MHRRSLLAAPALLGLASRRALAQAPARGGVLTSVIAPEPTLLTTALSTALAVTVVAPKMFDGLFVYDWDFRPQPGLATSLELAADGLSARIALRSGVKWHDGKPFTSADVAFTAMEVWKKLHPRLRGLLANLEAAETPDANTVVLRFSKPSPALWGNLMGYEAGILPRHVYEGTDIANNPANLRPVGTGPFRFAEWSRGEFIAMAVNWTSAEVKGLPSCQRMPRRRWKVMVLPSGVASQRSARTPTGLPAASRSTSGSWILPPMM